MNEPLPLKLSQLFSETLSALSSAGVENPQNEAEILISELLNIGRFDIKLRADEAVPSTFADIVRNAVVRRLRNEPLQYVLGHAYFRYLCLCVGPGVLIPRPETEILVGLAVKDSVRGASVCDIGTGSGAIALSIAFERPDLFVYASDISDAALNIAERNRQDLRLENVKFIKSDLFNSFSRDMIFETLIANLPYVTEDEYAHLPTELREYEPASALVSGRDGLDLIRRLIDTVPAYLEDDGLLFLEFGHTHGDAVVKLLQESQNFKNIRLLKDLNGVPRFIKAIKN